MGVYSLAKSSINNWAKYPTMMAGSTELSSDWLITQTVLGSNASTVTFDVSGLAAQGFKHLQIRAVTRNTNAAPSSTVNYGANGVIRFNGDSTTSYRAHYVQGDGASATSGDYGAGITCAYVPDLGGVWDSHTTNSYGGFVVDLLDFASSSKNKTIRSMGGFVDGGKRIALSSTAWFSTSPITSIVITEDGGSSGFKAGSRFSLYASKG